MLRDDSRKGDSLPFLKVSSCIANVSFTCSEKASSQGWTELLEGKILLTSRHWMRQISVFRMAGQCCPCSFFRLVVAYFLPFLTLFLGMLQDGDITGRKLNLASCLVSMKVWKVCLLRGCCNIVFKNCCWRISFQYLLKQLDLQTHCCQKPDLMLHRFLNPTFKNIVFSMCCLPLNNEVGQVFKFRPVWRVLTR